MTASTVAASSASTEQIRSMRTGILIHPSTARDGRCLILPHPRTQVPTYFLYSDASDSSAASQGDLFELSTLKDTKYDRSWMISGVNQVISSGQLEILSNVDVRFLVVSLLNGLGDNKFRSIEDTFEQIALALYGNRKEEIAGSVAAVKAKLNDNEGEGTQEWTDILTFGALPIVQKALEEVSDVQDLPNGEQAYRLSQTKIFSILDTKHSRLSAQSTFAASPNMLGRTFERRWPLESDPSPYLAAGLREEEDRKEAKELRRRIAAEIIATELPPRLAAEYFAHLGIADDK